MLRLRRLRLAGGRPLIVQTSYLPLPLADGLDPADLGRRGLYTVLAGHGLAVTRAAETISPAVLGPLEAGYLARPAGSPALLSHRVSFTRPAWPWWTTTRCCPVTAWPSPPTGPPTGWTCTTRCARGP